MDTTSDSDTDIAGLSADRSVMTRVYQWAYRFLQNHDDALDATQDVLIKWLGGGHRGVENRTAWLRRTTVNRCIDLIRTRRIRARYTPAELSVTTPIEHAAHTELQARIMAGIAELSDQQRAVLVAKVYDQETFASISAAMRISVSSAKTHYLRALRTLRELLRDYEPRP